MAVTEAKKEIVSKMKSTLSESRGAVLVGYSGLTVAEVTDLRRKFIAEGVDYKVVKNTLTRIAADELGLDGFSEHLEGPTAIAYSKDDPIAPARILENFIEDTKSKALTVKVGLLNGDVLDAGEVSRLAKLPNREGMLSMLLSVLQAPVRNVAYAVKAVADSKEEPAAE